MDSAAPRRPSGSPTPRTRRSAPCPRAAGLRTPRSCVRAGVQTSGHIHDLALFHAVPLELAGDAPFAHDDHAIAHPDDLFQLARDEDDGSSLCRQLREETVDLLFRG